MARTDFGAHTFIHSSAHIQRWRTRATESTYTFTHKRTLNTEYSAVIAERCKLRIHVCLLTRAQSHTGRFWCSRTTLNISPNILIGKSYAYVCAPFLWCGINYDDSFVSNNSKFFFFFFALLNENNHRLAHTWSLIEMIVVFDRNSHFKYHACSQCEWTKIKSTIIDYSKRTKNVLYYKWYSLINSSLTLCIFNPISSHPNQHNFRILWPDKKK